MTLGPDFLPTVETTLRRLAPPTARLVIAASGGPDSQALLDLVGRLHAADPWPAIWVVGVDHGLRPEARDELRLAEALATAHGLPFVHVAVRVALTGNLLAAARRARYAAIHKFAHEHEVTRILVAHTATDQAETVLHHLARGAGLDGMAGIREKRGTVVRPLLAVGRAAIVGYLRWRRITWAEDPSNCDRRRLRTRLREHVLPALRGINPQLERSVARWASGAAQDARLLRHLARRAARKRLGPLGALRVDGIADLPWPIATRMLRRWLASRGLAATRDDVERLLQGCQRRAWRVCVAGRVVSVHGGYLWDSDHPPYDEPLPVPGQLDLDALRAQLVATQRLALASSEHDAAAWLGGQKADRQGVAFDGDRLHLGLRVRAWRHGDRMQPFGLNGHVQVGDLFTDAKIPSPMRAAWPLVTHGEEILWVVGLRRSAAAPITAGTKTIVTIGVEGEFLKFA